MVILDKNFLIQKNIIKMQETTICNLCNNPQSISDTLDYVQVPCNIREFGHENFTVWRCENCGSLHSKEVVDLDRYYKNYPGQNQQLDLFTKIALRNRLAILTRLGLKKHYSILDYGCGKGLFVDYLKSKNFQISGYDPYYEMYAQKTTLQNRFDVLTAEQVIEHVLEPYEMLKRCKDLLEENGLLFIGSPNASEINLTQIEYYVHDLHQPFHRHILSESALVDLCEKAGFKHLKTLKRVYNDTWFPFLNVRFMWAYVNKTGGFGDVVFESPAYKTIISSPNLLFWGLFGGFVPSSSYMTCVFQKQ